MFFFPCATAAAASAVVVAVTAVATAVAVGIARRYTYEEWLLHVLDLLLKLLLFG